MQKKTLNYDWLINNIFFLLIRWMQHYSYIYKYMFRRSMQQFIKYFFVNLKHAKNSYNYDWLIINNYLMLIRWIQHYSYIDIDIFV